MTQQKRTFKPGLFLIALAVPSLGVLTGCEYCTPVLFAMIIGKCLITGRRRVSEALSIRPLADR